MPSLFRSLSRVILKLIVDASSKKYYQLTITQLLTLLRLGSDRPILEGGVESTAKYINN